MTIELTTTDKRDGRALALFARHDAWQRGHTKDGRPFFAIPGSEAGLFHMVDTRECSCPDFQRAGSLCKHVRAVRMWMVAFQTGAVAPRPRPATPGVTDDAGIGDDLIILLPDGAALLAEVAPTTRTRKGYVDIFPPCRQCGDLCDGRDRLCDRCASEREWQARHAN